MSFLCLKSFKQFRFSYRITSLRWHCLPFQLAAAFLSNFMSSYFLPYHLDSSHINWFRDPVWTGCTLSFSMSLSELFLLLWKFIPQIVDTVVILLSSVLILSIATPILFTYPTSLVLWFELSALANHHDFTLWFQSFWFTWPN